MAKFKQGDKIRMVEDKDYVVTVEKVTKNGYELSNRFKVYFKEESDWELDTPGETSTQTKDVKTMEVNEDTEREAIYGFINNAINIEDDEVYKITITKE